MKKGYRVSMGFECIYGNKIFKDCFGQFGDEISIASGNTTISANLFAIPDEELRKTIGETYKKEFNELSDSIYIISCRFTGFSDIVPYEFPEILVE